MAKALYGGGILDVRGSIGGQVHSRNTYGNYIRRKVAPVQPRTARQLEVRQLFAELSRRFSTILSDEQQEAWRQAAANTQVKDAFGDSIALTGINLYTRLNSLRLLMEQPPLDEPPPIQAVPSLTNFWALYDVDQKIVDVRFNPDPVPSDHYLFVWATEPLNPGIKFVSHKLRLLTIFPPGTSSAMSITPAYTERYGDLIPGKAIYLAGELVHVTGWKGARSLTKVRICC
jgi:hypothetical protein